MAAFVLAHALLLPAGVWSDEYAVIPGLAEDGWRGLAYRLGHWSPRPIAETMYAGYAHAVRWAGAPLIAPVLALLWTALVLGLAEWWRGAGDGRTARQLVSLALLATFLLGHGVSEAFFWPAGALAYLPALAALGLLLTVLLRGHSANGWRAAACLLIVAGSCEVGAMFVVAFAALSVPIAGEARRRASWLGWGCPLVLALTVLWLLGTTRAAGGGETLLATSATIHRPLSSIVAAAPPFVHGLLGGADWVGLKPLDVASRLLLLLGFRCCLAGAALPWPAVRPLLVFAIAALAAAYGSVAAAQYQFGVLCCSRHETTRQALYAMGAVAIAALSLRAVPGRPRTALGATLLLLGLLPAAVPRAAAVWHDARLIPAVAAARSATWASGQAPGEAMQFTLPPETRVLDRPYFGAGEATAADPRWYMRGILGFFGKQRMHIVAAPAPDSP